MILVDTTVWVDYFNGAVTPQTDYLDSALSQERIVVGDIILAEVLQGFRGEAEFEAARLALGRFQQAVLLGPELAVESARNYRFLRQHGITVRKPVDCWIATYCIASGCSLLHKDRDFDPFSQHLGLQVVGNWQ